MPMNQAIAEALRKKAKEYSKQVEKADKEKRKKLAQHIARNFRTAKK